MNSTELKVGRIYRVRWPNTEACLVEKGGQAKYGSYYHTLWTDYDQTWDSKLKWTGYDLVEWEGKKYVQFQVSSRYIMCEVVDGKPVFSKSQQRTLKKELESERKKKEEEALINGMTFKLNAAGVDAWVGYARRKKGGKNMPVLVINQESITKLSELIGDSIDNLISESIKFD